MSDTIQVRTSARMPKCGFCAWPSQGSVHAPDARLHKHGEGGSSCPVGILNGDGSVLKCDCECSRNLVRCLDCGQVERPDPLEGDVNPATWRCFDPDDCRAKIEKRLAESPIIQMIRAVRAGAEERVREERATRPAREGRPTSGRCLHCGEPTKGGMFLPGHDATFLSAAIKTITAGDTTLVEVLNAWTELGISEALRGKLEKRAS